MNLASVNTRVCEMSDGKPRCPFVQRRRKLRRVAVGLGLLAGGLVLGGLGEGRAEAQTQTPSADSVRLKLRADRPDLEFTLYAPGSRPIDALAKCGAGCVLALRPGPYWLGVRNPSDSVYKSSRPIFVTDGGEYLVHSPSRARRSAGLGMAVTGTVLFPLGSIVTWIALLVQTMDQCTYSTYSESSYGSSSCASSSPHGTAGVWIGAGMMVAGAILAPVGWVQFARNRKPRLELLRSGSASSEQGAQLTFGPQGIQGGFGWGTRLAF